jgi:hypothetical protein
VAKLPVPTLGRALRNDPSSWSLLLANLVTGIFAVAERWSLSEMMLVYWMQSVAIGIFNFARMLSLRRFTTEGLRENDRPVAPTRATQVRMAIFFLIHYGFFHLGYLAFLGFASRGARPEPLPLAICAGTFLLNHFYSFLHNVKEDVRRLRNLGTIMFAPYPRIVPMHLTILSGLWLGPGPAGTVLFLGLKTLADLVMHAIEHRERADAAVPAGPAIPASPVGPAGPAGPATGVVRD